MPALGVQNFRQQNRGTSHIRVVAADNVPVRTCEYALQHRKREVVPGELPQLSPLLLLVWPAPRPSPGSIPPILPLPQLAPGAKLCSAMVRHIPPKTIGQLPPPRGPPSRRGQGWRPLVVGILLIHLFGAWLGEKKRCESADAGHYILADTQE